MRFDTLEVKDKAGQTIVLRNAEESDAEDLIKYLRITTGETPFLIREPDEVKLTLEQEKHFITSCIDSERELMLIATINGRHKVKTTPNVLIKYRKPKTDVELLKKVLGVSTNSEVGELTFEYYKDAEC